jgi:hypothetical protein
MASERISQNYGICAEAGNDKQIMHVSNRQYNGRPLAPICDDCSLRVYHKIISEAPEKSGCLLAEARAKAFARIFPVPFRNFGAQINSMILP